jgi:hypothetical protein
MKMGIEDLDSLRESLLDYRYLEIFIENKGDSSIDENGSTQGIFRTSK